MTRMPRHIRHRRGFTLIEAIAALVVLSIAMPAVLWGIRDSVRRRADPVLLSRARWLASSKLEDVIADRHSSSRGYSYLVAGNYAAETPVSGFSQFNRSVAFTVTGANFAVGTGWTTATVTVSWTDGQGASRSLAMSTVVTDYTP